jgi:hypothetical protein
MLAETSPLQHPIPAIKQIRSESDISSSLDDTISFPSSPRYSLMQSIQSSTSTSPVILSNMQINHRTPAMMPSPRAKEAPAKFTGKYEDVKRFIKRYNNLCLAYNVDNDSDKCERVLDYCSCKVIRLIESLTSYTTKNWTALEKDLLHYYDADRKETHYIIRDLTQFTQEWKHRSVRTLTKWKIYE